MLKQLIILSLVKQNLLEVLVSDRLVQQTVFRPAIKCYRYYVLRRTVRLLNFMFTGCTHIDDVFI